MKQFILDTALKVAQSTRYQNTKKDINAILNDSNNPKKRLLDLFMIFLIVTSILILIYEVQNTVPEWISYYDIYIVSFIFLIEYILRIWVYSDIHKIIVDEYHKAKFLGKEFHILKPLWIGVRAKFNYLITPSAIIDLLAILPAYRPIRILRFFVLFRVFKILRYTKSINQFVDVLSNKRFELFTLLFILIFVMTASGIAIYVFEENQNDNINSLFDALYWALVTISTVGYGDISPVTIEGRIISMLIIVSGIAMISFATSVIVSAFSEKLGELKEHRVIDKIDKRRNFLIICGYSELTKIFLKQADEKFNNYVILDKDSHRVREAINDGYFAICDDASKQEALKRYDISFDKITVMCLVNSDIENIYIALNAKSISPQITIIARASDSKLINKYKLAGADQIILPNNVANTMLLSAINNPLIYKASHALLMGKHVALIDEVRAKIGDKLVGNSINTIDFKSHKILFIGVQRGEDSSFLFNPALEMIILDGDILLVMGMQLSVEYFKERYQKR
jgi:voltage-gated potassium channel